MRSLRLAVAVLILATAQAASAFCWISMTGPSFGAYDPLASAPVDAAGSLQYWCTTSAMVTLSAGNAGTYVMRRMQGGGSTLGYNLYSDAGRTQVWGDGTSGSVSVTVPAGFFQAIPVFGRIPARQNVDAGSYSDSLIVTFTF